MATWLLWGWKGPGGGGGTGEEKEEEEAVRLVRRRAGKVGKTPGTVPGAMPRHSCRLQVLHLGGMAPLSGGRGIITQFCCDGGGVVTEISGRLRLTKMYLR